jgi:hypothetical protein
MSVYVLYSHSVICGQLVYFSPFLVSSTKKIWQPLSHPMSEPVANLRITTEKHPALNPGANPMTDAFTITTLAL